MQNVLSAMPTAELLLLKQLTRSYESGGYLPKPQPSLNPEQQQPETLTPATPEPLTGELLAQLARAVGAPIPGETLPEGALSPEDFSDVAAAEQSLYEFIRQAWHVLEPGVEFKPGWHLEAICLHLESIAEPGGPIENLIVNVPPGTMKSLAQVFFRAWVWGPRRLPSLRIMAFSYGAELSTEHSVKVRNLIESEWYQQRWGHVFQLTDDQNQKTKFENDKRGWQTSSSVGGRGTGIHADIVIIDDPHKAKDSEGSLLTRETDAERTSVISWYKNTIASRGVIRGVRRVLIMQRLHQEDLCGYILGSESASEWTHICLPMRAEPNRMATTPIGWNDPRDEGDLLWPDGYTEAKTKSLEATLGSLLSAGQLQQRPIKAGGEMFPRERFVQVDAPPATARRVRAWDKASTAGGGAFTVGVLMAEHGGQFFIEDVIRKQLDPLERNRLMVQTAQLDAQKYSNTVQILIEQEPSAGKETAAINVRELAGFPVCPIAPVKAKDIRAMPYAAQVQAGNVFYVKAEWNAAFLDEHEVFPLGKYLDQVDAAAMAFNRLVSSKWMPSGGPVLASGDAADREPFTAKEIQELPQFLKDVITGLEDDDGTDGEGDDWGRKRGGGRRW